MKKVLSAIGISGALYLLPLVSFAQSGGPSASFGQIGTTITHLITFINATLVPLVFALAFLVFLWGVFKYFFWGGGEEEKREEGKQLMLWAIIAFVIMVSVWGIVNVVASGLGFRAERIEQIPDAPTTNN